MTDGNRLARWRESLPRSGKRPISASSLSHALGWRNRVRWTQLEKLDVFSEQQRDEVKRAVRGVCAWLDVDEGTVDACVAHVLDSAPAPELRAWREGQCPALPMGRPLGTGRPIKRVIPGHDEDDPPPPPFAVARPILPEQVRRHQVAAVLRALSSGELDERTATEAIGDIYEPLRIYYNKYDAHDAHEHRPDVA